MPPRKERPSSPQAASRQSKRLRRPPSRSTVLEPSPDAPKRGRLKRSAKKKRAEDPEKSHYDKKLSRVRHQLSRIRQERALIEAYEAEGWRGAAREKVRPVQEIRRAKAQVLHSIEVIRHCVRYCDEAEGDKAIPSELFDEDGEIDSDHIFCAKCGQRESTDDNDIILCDGPCNRAYHCKCLTPPLDPATLTEDEGWLCPACDHKVDMLSLINDEFGTDYDLEDSWEKILTPTDLQDLGLASANSESAQPTMSVSAPTSLSFVSGADLPSEDEEDSDYGEESSASGGDSTSLQSPRKQAESNSDESSSSASDASDLADEDGDELMYGDANGHQTGCEQQRLSAIEATLDPEDPDAQAELIVSGPRRRKHVDYKALHAQMFGETGPDDEEEQAEQKLVVAKVDEDEDDEPWSPRTHHQPYGRGAQEQQALSP